MEPSGESILIIDDDPDIQEILRDRLESLGYRVFIAPNGKQGLEVVEKNGPHMVLLDEEMPEMKGFEVLKEIHKRGNEIPIVIITAYGTIDRVVQAMKEGAYDFVAKPFESDHIALIVQKAMERERLKREKGILSEQVGGRYQLVIGGSTKMKLAIDSAKKAAMTKSTVLLLGESGTGKELVAHATHNWSERKDKPFIAINCVGLSKELLESELFGHERGAFTGAHQLKKGKMELGHGGTVFLDEVGDISSELQTKLLRFLQEREFERVGGTQTIRVDVRIIAATNRNLEVDAREGTFREDLYYRLNVVPITLLPLRERREDILSLAHYFLVRFSKEVKKRFTEITQEAQEKLQAYDWPGNVRELANVVERAVVLGDGPLITVRDLPLGILATEPGTRSDGLSYRKVIDSAKRELILRALDQSQGNRAAAARLLGLQRTYLSRLIKTLRIS